MSSGKSAQNLFVGNAKLNGTHDLPDDPQHRLNALELGGGALLDLGIYPVSFAWDILGKPQEILSMARFKATGADAEVATIFRHGGGAMSTTVSSSDNAGRNVASILGTEARIDIDATYPSGQVTVPADTKRAPPLRKQATSDAAATPGSGWPDALAAVRAHP